MKIGYDHKAWLLKQEVSIPYYTDYAGMEATPLAGHYPNCRQVVYCYTKKDILNGLLRK